MLLTTTPLRVPLPADDNADTPVKRRMDPEESPEELPQVGNDPTWTPEVEGLLGDWRNRVYAAQSAHYSTADHFRLLNYWVGVPAVIFSSVVGTALFANLEADTAKTTTTRTVLVASAIISILAAILTGLQTFLRFAERAAHHATAGDWYSAIRRDIEQLLSLPVEIRGKPKECLDSIRKEMNRASQDSPELSGRQWRRQAKRFKVREPTSPM